ncbi:MAG: ribose-phosphate pyrophosphokinase [Candidatus Levybacteria bacterium]|nr:ribose-phosphate pyrophosphokinase [Candidatus Levybacteria bacterium]
MKLFSGSSNHPLAKDIAIHLDIPLSPVEFFLFPDGEQRVRIEESIVDEDVIIVQSTSTPVDSYYMELFFLIDSAKRNGAKSVTVVMPYVGYQRQDHIFRDGEAVSLDVVIKMLESLGVDNVIAVDLHSIKIPELFHIPLIHISALPLFAYVIGKLHWPRLDMCLVSPDMGGIRRIKLLSALLDGMPFVATKKNRDLTTGAIEINDIEGDTTSLKKYAIIVDDMISSGKTIVKSAELLKKHGVEQIYVFATHAIFSEEAPQILQNSPITKVFVTDSVLIPKEKRFEKLEVIGLAQEVAKTLKTQSMSS